MFGNYLIENGITTYEEIKEALRLQRFKKEKLGRLLKDLGYLDEKSLDQSLESYFQAKCLKKTSQLIEMKNQTYKSSKVSESEKNFLEAHCLEIIELNCRKNEVTLVGCQYRDSVIQKAETIFNKNVTLKVIRPDALHILTSKGNSVVDAKLSLAHTVANENRLEESNPYSRLIRESVDEALRRGASDIHYEPFDLAYIIRFRIHGTLLDWKTFNKTHAKTITDKLKLIINMDPAIVGQPQDSRASFSKRKVDIRASSFPVISGGEKIVLRLQRQNETLLLEELGLSPEVHQTLVRSIEKSDGLILISGPTGSGKTTTLYALLEKMDKRGKNISTIENPVEKSLERINQGNIVNFSDFENFERALMRQDPDIILIGEVRDRKTAELCMRLASTGHLVLSTIHANGSVEVVERLKDLGINSFSIRSSLYLSIAQRLAKKLCPFCSIDASAELATRAFKEYKYKVNQDPTNFNKNTKSGGGVFTRSKLDDCRFKVSLEKGCQKCQGGVCGRIAVLEYLGRERIQFLLENRTKAVKPKESIAGEYFRLASQGTIDVREMINSL